MPRFAAPSTAATVSLVGSNADLKAWKRDPCPKRAAALRTVGFVEGDDEGVRAAGTVFAGGVPWMTDMF